MMSNQDYRDQKDQISPSTQPAQSRSMGTYLAGLATGLAILGVAGGGYAMYRFMGGQPAPVAIAPSAPAPIAPSAPAPAAPAPASSPTSPAGSIGQSAPAPVAPTASTPTAGSQEANGTDGDFAFNVRVLELKRVSGSSVLLRLAVTNTGQQNGGFALLNVTGNESIYVVDTQSQQKAYPLRDAKGAAVASQPVYNIAPGQTTEIFAQFPAPPATTQKLTIYFPHTSSPIADVPITQ